MTPKPETRPTAVRRPRAVVYRGTILATADVEAAPERVFRALTVEAEKGWRDCGITADGVVVEIDPPRMIIQTLGETAVTFSLASISSGTRVTVRHEGFAGGRSPAEEYVRCWEEALTRLQSSLRDLGLESPQGGANVESRHRHP